MCTSILYYFKTSQYDGDVKYGKMEGIRGNMEKKQYTVGETLLGILFLVWFFASIIALLMTAKTYPWLALVIFGQYFLVFGFIALVNMLKNDNFTPIILLFIIVGAGVASWGLIMQYGNKELQEKFEKMIPYLGLGLFGVVGALSLLNTVVRKRREEKCTQLVTAICVKIKKKMTQTTTNGVGEKEIRHLVCPVFQYTYNGKNYEVCHDTYTRSADMQIGDTCYVYINPEKPKIFRAESETARLNSMELTIGVLFLAVSIGGIMLIKVLG